jgi:hypothetical protein
VNRGRRSAACWLGPVPLTLHDHLRLAPGLAASWETRGKMRCVVPFCHTTVAVSQRDLKGICLLLAADFTFLPDGHRRARQPQVH